MPQYIIVWDAQQPGVDQWDRFTATVNGQVSRCHAYRQGTDLVVEYPCAELLMTHLALIRNAKEQAALPAATPSGPPLKSGPTTATAGASRPAAAGAASSWTNTRLPGTEPTDLERRTATRRQRPGD